MTDHMTLSHWFIYILSQRLVAGTVHTVQRLLWHNFVAANQFEFVRLIAAAKFCRSDNDFRMIGDYFADLGSVTDILSFPYSTKQLLNIFTIFSLSKATIGLLLFCLR